ncbi:MAG: peptide maturation system acyl carrier-related protein [Clostridia bacterium]|nr:peptide maturation system acyl carrier-related protein [Clostridia bacterium]
MNSTIVHDDVNSKLKDVFKNRFDLDIAALGEEALDRELLGAEIRFAPRDLLYLFFDIEKNFDITIPQEAIISGKFNTFNNIVEIICSVQEGKCLAV